MRAAGGTPSRVAATQWLKEPMHLHFLCNTLHLLQGLVHRDPDRVERMLDEMCELLSHLLHSTRVPDVPLRDELAALAAYASLQKLRFQERLDVAFDMDPDVADWRVPGFMLYPLVENAVKFGLETGPHPVLVRIAARAHEGRLCIDVSNTGRWVTPGAQHAMRGHGLAIAAVQERLDEILPGRHRFTLLEDAGWVRARIEVPGPPSGAAPERVPAPGAFDPR